MREHYTDRASSTVSRISCEIPNEGITLKDFLNLIGEEGGLLTCIILIAPFLFPVSFPGSSIPFGLAILLINIGIISKKHPLIPKKIME
ncbi:MAG: exopolysaccharide biosynthesis protein, partial [Methanobacterium sp.]|nr:exopolysaccharide biosynthesis protein [Methanobacterium sp.]